MTTPGLRVQTHLRHLEITGGVPASVQGSEVTELNPEVWREKRQTASSWQCPGASGR